MSQHVKHDPNGNAPWVDNTTGERKPKGWRLDQLAQGDQYTDRHGNTWTVQRTDTDPITGAVAVTATMAGIAQQTGGGG